MTRSVALLALTALLTPAASLAQEPGPPPDWNVHISGRVVSADTGLPLARVQVSINSTFLFTKEVPSVSETVTSDANGLFEFDVVPPGDYSVNAAAVGYYLKGPGRFAPAGGPRVSVGDREKAAVNLAMTRGGAITGRLVDELGEPVAGVVVHALRYSYQADGSRRPFSAGVNDITDDLGHFRLYGLSPGDFAVVANGRNAVPGPTGSFSALTQADSPPTYYPGTLNVEEAQTVSLGDGQEASVQFAVRHGRVVRLSGGTVTSNGLPAAGRVMLWRPSAMAARASDPIVPDGTFTLSGVTPGDYWLQVRTRGTDGEVGVVPVTVGNEDITGLSIVTNPGATLRGTIVFEGQRPDAFTPFRLAASLADGMHSPYGFVGFGGVVELHAEGRFEARNVVGRVTLTTSESAWMVKSLTLGGVDVLDTGIDLAGKEVVSGVRITVTDKLTRVSGLVADDQGEPLRDRIVILLRLDARPPATALTGAVPLGIRAVRTDAAGRFDARKLRPGSWVAGVVDDLEPGYEFSPDFQDRLRMYGQRFSLSDGEEVVVNLEPTPSL